MLTTQEKQLLNHACNVYLQVAAQELGPDDVKQLTAVFGGIFQKIEQGIGTEKSERPEGITEEWFEGVCKSCEQLKGTQCDDKVTVKYPGKCDPILKFERDKVIAMKKEQIVEEHNSNIIDGTERFKGK